MWCLPKPTCARAGVSRRFARCRSCLARAAPAPPALPTLTFPSGRPSLTPSLDRPVTQPASAGWTGWLGWLRSCRQSGAGNQRGCG